LVWSLFFLFPPYSLSTLREESLAFLSEYIPSLFPFHIKGREFGGCPIGQIRCNLENLFWWIRKKMFILAGIYFGERTNNEFAWGELDELVI